MTELPPVDPLPDSITDLLHRVDDKLVVAFQYPYGCPGVLRSQPEMAYGQGTLFAPAR